MHENNIVFGPATLAAPTTRATAKELPDQEADKELVPSDNKEEVITDDNDDNNNDNDIDLAFGSALIKSKSSKMFFPKKKRMFSPTSGALPGQHTANLMPSFTEDHAAYDDDTNPDVDALDFKQQCGTKRVAQTSS
jgi:hypothetical protein